jgi:protein O-mannosyl-transferase
VTALLLPTTKRSAGNASAGQLARSYYEFVALGLIVLTTFVVYLPAIHGQMLWDDNFYLTRPELQSLEGLSRIWSDPSATAQYYPMVHSAFWLEHKLWNDHYVGYHLLNVALHLFSVVLLYLLLVRLEIPGALLAAAIFALHPVMVESVAWMTEQKNTLSTVFYLGALWLYLDFDRSRHILHYLFALGLFALALLTKTVAVTFPVALLILFWWQRGTVSWRRDVWPLIPFFAISAGTGVMTIWVERMRGAKGPEFAMTFSERVLVAGRDVWFYLQKLIWPTDLTFIYPRWVIDSHVWWQWIFPVAALILTALLWIWRRRTRAILAAWLFYCVTLFPVLGFVNVFFFTYSFVADHFQYLASLGMIVLASAGIARAIDSLPKRGRLIGVAMCGLGIGVLALLTLWQAPMYADGITLYETTLKRNPNCWLAHNNLGTSLGEKDDHASAMEHYQAALRIKPDYADAHNNLGNEFTHSGRMSDAVSEFEAAIAAKDDNPTYHVNLASALTEMGRVNEAIDQCREALRIEPNSFDAHHNFGAALARAGKIPQATEHFRRAVALNENFAAARVGLAQVLAAQANFTESIAQFETAIQLGAGGADVHNGLGDSYRMSGNINRAIEQYQIAVRERPHYMPAQANLAQTLAFARRSQEAIAVAEQAIELARSTGQQDELRQFQEWLKYYRNQLNRDTRAELPANSPPPSSEPKSSR